jgi:predicted anti-sigma-YlaC factor YlaD
MKENAFSKCNTLLDYLSDYIDGELGLELCAKIEHHVAECQNCRIVVDTLRKTISIYHETAAEDGEVSENVRERLFRSLNLDDYIRR